MHIVYLPEAAEGPAILPEEESKHIIRVMRLQAGDKVLVTNGKSLFFEATLFDAHPKRAVLQLGAGFKGNEEWGFHLHLAMAPTKNMDRTEWFVEKATEIGVDEISFFVSRHSERRALNIERLEKIAVAAIKQSRKSRLPKLNPLLQFDQFIGQVYSGQRFIAWIDESVTALLTNSYCAPNDCVVLIGPEGDFSPEEVEMATKAGFEAMSLGKARLRTETAALTAVQTIQILNQIVK